jgi:hypothetical protein
VPGWDSAAPGYDCGTVGAGTVTEFGVFWFRLSGLRFACW